MELIAFGQCIVNGIVKFLAPTKFGQFFIKKIDRLFWSLEQVGKYSVAEASRAESNKFMQANTNHPLKWLVFGVVLIYMQIFRVASSMVLVKFNRNPIESKDIVKTLQKWRRMLRSIRFAGLRKSRELEIEARAENGKDSKSNSIFDFFKLNKFCFSVQTTS